MRFEILGPLRIGDGDAEHAVTAGRDRIVLSMLLLHAGRIVGVDRLIEAVWESMPPVTARAQLQTCVSRLRRALPTATITTDPAGYVIHLGTEDLDAAVFDRLTERAVELSIGSPDESRRLFRTALDLWRGPALTGIESGAVRSGAAVLDERHAVAIEDWVDLELSGGRDRDLIGELAGLVKQFPLRERLRAQLMLALVRAGRQADALAEYRRARTVLHDELGIEPGSDLRELHRRILVGESETPLVRAAPRPMTPVRCLPRTVGDFTGRGHMIDRIVRQIEQGTAAAPVIAVIDGMAGSGKTTLALHLASVVGDRYRDAQLFIDLHGHSAQQPVEPAAALITLLRQLGVGAERIPAGIDERAAMWRTELAARRALVVLDNAASTAQISRLLPAAPGSLVLITSRRRLTGLDGVRPESLLVLSDDEAVALLARIVGDRVRDEPAAALEVVRRCGRLPLAIRLAGSRLAHRPRWQVSDLLRRLDAAALPELAAEDRTVAGAFALSYGQLGASAQRMFRVLGLHPGERFDAPAVAALTDLSLDEAEDLLYQLVDVHLVEEPESGIFRMHDLIREYAGTLAAAEPEAVRREAVLRLVDHTMHTAAGLSRRLENLGNRQTFDPGRPLRADLMPDASVDPLEWLERERMNLIAVSRSAESWGESRYVWMIARAAWRMWYLRGYYDDLIDVHQRGLSAARAAGDELAAGMMANYLASGFYRTGRPRDAVVLLAAAQANTARIGRTDQANLMLINLAATQIEIGDFSAAEANAHRALEIQRRKQNLLALPGIFNVLSTIAFERRRWLEALAWDRRSLQVARQLNSPSDLYTAFANLAQIRLYLGHSQAERYVRLAAKLALRGSRIGAPGTLSALGIYYQRRGEFARAVVEHRRALEMNRHLADRRMTSRLWNDFAETSYAAGDHATAEAQYREGLALAVATQHRLEEARAYAGIGNCLQVDDPDESRRCWERASAMFTAMDLTDRFEVERRPARPGRSTGPGRTNSPPAESAGRLFAPVIRLGTEHGAASDEQ